jgi:ribosomal protein L40E
LTVDESKAGGTVECPGCKRGTFVPKSPSRESAGEEGPKLQSARQAVEEEQPTTGGKQKKCPVCGGEVPPYAVVCRHCGYDWRTGEFSGKARLKRMGTWLIVAGIVIGLAVVAWVARPLFLPQEVPTLVDTAPPAPQAETGDMAPEDETVSTTAPDRMNDETTEGSASDTEMLDATEEEMPMDTVRTRVRDRVGLRVDRRYPRFERDEQVALRLRNGLVHRGTYLGVKNNTVVLIQEEGSKEVPLDDLDRTTRLRCDTAFRERFIDFQTERYMQRVETGAEESR